LFPEQEQDSRIYSKNACQRLILMANPGNNLFFQRLFDFSRNPLGPQNPLEPEC
jgi:hypothetical protein